MLKLLRQNKAQAVMSEYLLIFFVTIGMISAMTIYFKRAVQARVYSARHFVVNDIAARIISSGYYAGNIITLYTQYEPYYANTQSLVDRRTSSTETIVGDAPGKTGIYRKAIDDYTRVMTNSRTSSTKFTD